MKKYLISFAVLFAISFSVFGKDFNIPVESCGKLMQATADVIVDYPMTQHIYQFKVGTVESDFLVHFHNIIPIIPVEYLIPFMPQFVKDTVQQMTMSCVQANGMLALPDLPTAKPTTPPLQI